MWLATGEPESPAESQILLALYDAGASDLRDPTRLNQAVRAALARRRYVA